MAKQRIIAVLAACVSLALFTVQTQSKTGNKDHQAKSRDGQQSSDESERQKANEEKEFFKRLRNMSEDQAIKALQERARERAIRDRRLRPQRLQKLRESQKEVKKHHDEFLQEWKEAGGLLWEKRMLTGLGATPEQWKLIKARLEKVRELRKQSNSIVGLILAGGSNDSDARPTRRERANVPSWQWKIYWKDKNPSDLTEAQKLANRLIALVKNKRTTPEQFERSMEALRKARREETEPERQLSQARQDLCQALTTRQKAALVLMGRL